MNERQAFALAHPYNGEDISPYVHHHHLGDDAILTVILAVDR